MFHTRNVEQLVINALQIFSVLTLQCATRKLKKNLWAAVRNLPSFAHFVWKLLAPYFLA